MKTTAQIQERYKKIYDMQAQASINADLALKIESSTNHHTAQIQIRKYNLQMRELAWVLDGEVVNEKTRTQ